MKKLMMIAAFVVATMTANAQREIGTWTIQPKGGLGFSTVTNVDDSKMTLAAMFGGEVEYQVGDIASVAGGLNFSLQGCGIKDHGGYEDISRTLGYINVPVVANVYFAKGWAVKAGVQVGFMVYSCYSYKVGNTRTEVTSKDGLNKVDFSIPVGVSYEFSRVPIVIDARWNIGMTKIVKDSDKTNANSVLMATVGYRFNL